MTGTTTLTMELLSTETKTAEIKTPIRSRRETPACSVAAPSALKPRPRRAPRCGKHPRAQRAPAWARPRSSSPPATCRLCQPDSNVHPQIPISSSPKHVVSKDLLRPESGVEVTPYPDQQLLKCLTCRGGSRTALFDARLHRMKEGPSVHRTKGRISPLPWYLSTRPLCPFSRHLLHYGATLGLRGDPDERIVGRASGAPGGYEAHRPKRPDPSVL